MGKVPMDQRRRLTLEDYIFFFGSHSGEGLTIDLLNQIVFMHGFVKFHRSTKPAILDALNSVELLRPRRSTVSINAVAPPPGAAAPSAAALSTEDVKRDISDLGWRECPIGSLLSVSAPSPVPLATILPGSGAVQRVSPQSALTSPLPPAAPALAGKRKWAWAWASTGQGKMRFGGGGRRAWGSCSPTHNRGLARAAASMPPTAFALTLRLQARRRHSLC